MLVFISVVSSLFDEAILLDTSALISFIVPITLFLMASMPSFDTDDEFSFFCMYIRYDTKIVDSIENIKVTIIKISINKPPLLKTF